MNWIVQNSEYNEGSINREIKKNINQLPHKYKFDFLIIIKMSKQLNKTRKRKIVTKLAKSSQHDTNFESPHSNSYQSKLENQSKHKQQQLFQQQQHTLRQNITSPYLRILQAMSILKGTSLPTKFKFRQKQVYEIEQKIKQLVSLNSNTNLIRKKTAENAITSPTKSKSQNTKIRSQGTSPKTKIIMITGSPGAGKTMSVNFVLHKLQKQGFKVIDLNSNVIKKKKDVQSLLYSQLLQQSEQTSKQKQGGKQKKQKQRQKVDKNNLTTFKLISQLQKCKTKCILYVQQVELFFNSYKQSLSQDFFDIFTNKNLKIVLLGISNTIDALQKYGQKMNIHVNEVSNIVFNPYTRQQLNQIVKDKLQEVQKCTGIQIKVQTKLIKFITNKINEIKKGDMRIVFQFFKHLSNILFGQKPKSKQSQLQGKLAKNGNSFQIQVTIQHINTCFSYISGPNTGLAKNKLITTLPLNLQIILLSIYRYFMQTQSLFITDETLKKKIRQSFQMLGLQPKRQFKNQLSDLVDYGLIAKSVSNVGAKNSRNQFGNNVGIDRYLLKLPLTDIKYCFQEHPVLGRLL